MPRFELSRRAQADLDAIADYSLEQWGKPQAAAYVGVSAQTFDKLVERGVFDRPLMLDERRRWDRHALDRAMDKLSGLNA